MEKYKPTYLGKVIPADDQNKLTDFVTNKYDSFSKMYDTCKDKSDKIDDIKMVETDSSDPSELCVKISTDKETINDIAESSKDDDYVTVAGDTITTKS